MYACELDVTMITMSHDILTANGMQDNITLLHSLSTKLSVPRDIPERFAHVKYCGLIPSLLYLYLHSQKSHSQTHPLEFLVPQCVSKL